MKNRAKKYRVSAKKADVQVRGTQIASINDTISLVRISTTKKRVETRRDRESARVLLPKFARAMAKPGIDRSVVFRDPKAKNVFAYYAYAGDPTKIVQESTDGTKRIGREVRGKFVAD